jgi:hypothetical protein
MAVVPVRSIQLIYTLHFYNVPYCEPARIQKMIACNVPIPILLMQKIRNILKMSPKPKENTDKTILTDAKLCKKV